MFAHEIAHTGADIQQRWLRIRAAIAYSGLPRSSLYRLLSQRVIRSISLASPNKTRGVRLVDRFELDALLSKLADDQNSTPGLQVLPAQPATHPTRRKARKPALQ
jgi:hypothetical protein